jgi:hypothetical protein
MNDSLSLKEMLLTRGADAVDEIVKAAQEESLHLEFKTLANHSASTLTKDDRRLIAKSICGFSNAEGGILLLGVETTRLDGVDVAAVKKDFMNVDTLRNRVVSAIPEMLSPQNVGISVDVLTDPGRPGVGSIMIDVPRSENRPHMSTVHHQYFRRGSDGTRVMEHGEVRELMLAPREAKLGLSYRVANTMSSGDLIYAFDLVLSLRNEGRVSVGAPFIAIKGADALLARDHDPAFVRRTRPLGGIGIYASRDILVHVEDQLDMAKIVTGLDLRATGQLVAKEAIEGILRDNDERRFSIRSWSESRQDRTGYDRLINADVSFGGEGSITRSASIKLDKWTLFRMMADEILKR